MLGENLVVNCLANTWKELKDSALKLWNHAKADYFKLVVKTLHITDPLQSNGSSNGNMVLWYQITYSIESIVPSNKSGFFLAIHFVKDVYTSSLSSRHQIDDLVFLLLHLLLN